MGQLKARDIVAGWPRGRSTEAPISFVRAFMRWPAFMELFKWDYIGDPRFNEDLEEERAEEQRKAFMMKAYVITMNIWRESGKPSECPGCFNDGRSKSRLAIYRERGYWLVRCFYCHSLWCQLKHGTMQLLRSGYDVTEPRIELL
ncbi:MAG TPA: hypothetical protein VGN44_05670 [Candidatus Angelobacter sp.]